MRQYNDINMRIEYPEKLMWLLDNNFVRCVNRHGAYKLTATLALTAGGVVTTYTHTTKIGDLTFRLTPYLRGLAHGTTITTLCSVTAYDANDNPYSYTLKFDMKIVYGKTLQERHHGSEGVVTYERLTDLQLLDLLKPAGWKGRITFGSFTQNYYDTDADIVQVPYFSPGPVEVNYIGNGTPIYRGDVWDETNGNDWDVMCVQVCPARNGIKLTYYNTDGCKRFAIGEVLKKTMSAERKEYRHGGVVYDEPPQSLVTGYAGTIEVGFRDVEPGQYLEDIMLSPTITTTRGGEIISLTPTTLQLVRDGETKDIIINFKIDA